MDSAATPPSGDEPTSSDALSAEIRKAATRSSLSALGGDSLDARTLVSAMGGVRGILEAILPGLIFLVAYTITRNLTAAIIGAGAVGILFTVVRLIQRQTLMQAVTGLVAIAVSAGLAALTGNAEDFYVPGFWTNGIYLAVLALSIIVRWPLIGVIVGVLTGDGNRWRDDRRLRRFYAGLTWLWVGMFVLRLAVELPLYYAGSFIALGTFKLLLGVPLYAPLLVITWLAVSAVRKRRAAAEVADET